ncbi:APO domain [Dillenia turbinata]|uniref:APO domain n=1 Tax=Dillenia turbinata TaxID=194707 RepID=A0AAN8VT79_9MAGN
MLCHAEAVSAMPVLDIWSSKLARYECSELSTTSCAFEQGSKCDQELLAVGQLKEAVVCITILSEAAHSSTSLIPFACLELPKKRKKFERKPPVMGTNELKLRARVKKNLCEEVHVGHPPHKIRTCCAAGSPANKEHTWQGGEMENILPTVESYHLYDRLGRAVSHLEVCIDKVVMLLNPLKIWRNHAVGSGNSYGKYENLKELEPSTFWARLRARPFYDIDER